MKRLILCMFLFATPALAQNCANPQTQTDLNICANQRYDAADAALDTTYKTLLAQNAPAGQSLLRAVQKSWIAYRNLQCDFNTLGTAEGSLRPLLMADCETTLTKIQTKLLAAQLACRASDPTCGQR